MSEVVERVALAAMAKHAEVDLAFAGVREARQGWEAIARAAILALREPTHRMVVAGHGAGVEPGADHDVPMSTFKDIYSAMIDAALSEGTEQ